MPGKRMSKKKAAELMRREIEKRKQTQEQPARPRPAESNVFQPPKPPKSQGRIDGIEL